MAYFTCIVCNTEFTAKPSAKPKFCSLGCRSSRNRGANHWAYKGGFTDKAGYRRISVNGIVYLEHRYVMAKHLGRPLTSSEVVHHKDHNRINNSIENLELMESNSAHRKHHGTFRSDTLKECTNCHQTKLRVHFHKINQKGRDPHRPCCIECTRDKKLNALSKRLTVTSEYM